MAENMDSEMLADRQVMGTHFQSSQREEGALHCLHLNTGKTFIHIN